VLICVYLRICMVIMFSTKEYIAKKTGPFGIGRLPFLQELVDEFQSTDSEGIQFSLVYSRDGHNQIVIGF